MITPVTHFNSLSVIRRQRMLPISGTVLVRAGQKVEPTEVIARAILEPKHIVLDIARGLGVARNEAGKYIQRQAGEEIEAGSTIASRPGLASRVVRAPVTCRLVAISQGEVMLEVATEPYQLLAGVPGVILKIEPDRGALIETTGAWLQCVWGNEKIDNGPLQVLAESPDHELNAEQVSLSQSGSVLLAGHCNNLSALEAGIEIPISGLILGSLSTKLIPAAKKLPFPVVVLEGFGIRPINQKAFKLLSTSGGRDVTLNAQSWNRFDGTRPEIIIPLDTGGDSSQPMEVDNLTAGKEVRIVSSPYPGQTARVARIFEKPQVFPSGLRTDAAEVEFANGSRDLVPLANMEVIR